MTDFDKLYEEIEAEAQTTDAVADLRAKEQKYNTASVWLYEPIGPAVSELRNQRNRAANPYDARTGRTAHCRNQEARY